MPRAVLYDPFRVYLWFTLWTIEVVERHRNYKTLNSTHTDPHRAKNFNNRLHFSDLEKLLKHDKIDEVAENSEDLYDLIKPIFHEEFKEESLNFRNREHHRDGPTIFTGSSAQVKEIIEDDGNKRYRVSIKEPIPLEKLVNSLDNELKKCRKAYLEFEKFVDSSFKIFD